jgi:hypothetical protein
MSISQSLHSNNRISLSIGEETAFYGVHYEHFSPINDSVSISSVIGVGSADRYLKFSIPLIYNKSYSETRRGGIGVAYTRMFYDKGNVKFYNEADDVIFLKMECSWLKEDTPLELTLDFTPLYDIRYKTIHICGSS